MAFDTVATVHLRTPFRRLQCMDATEYPVAHGYLREQVWLFGSTYSSLQALQTSLLNWVRNPSIV